MTVHLNIFDCFLFSLFFPRPDSGRFPIHATVSLPLPPPALEDAVETSCWRERELCAESNGREERKKKQREEEMPAVSAFVPLILFRHRTSVSIALPADYSIRSMGLLCWEEKGSGKRWKKKKRSTTNKFLVNMSWRTRSFSFHFFPQQRSALIARNRTQHGPQFLTVRSVAHCSIIQHRRCHRHEHTISNTNTHCVRMWT